MIDSEHVIETISDGDEEATNQISQITFAPLHWPCTFALVGLSIGITAAYLNGNDVSFAFADWHIYDGHYWRFVTSCFVHVDWVHLALNMYWLLEFGQPIERRLKPFWMLTLLAALAVGSGAATFVWYGSAGIGMSGVLYGFFTMLWATRETSIFDYKLPARTVAIFVVWFFACIFLTYTDIWGVGNVAHASGALLGYFIGKAMCSEHRGRNIAGVGMLTTGLMLTTLYMPWHYTWWWHKGYDEHELGEYSKSLDSYGRSIAMADNDRLVENLLLTAAKLAANQERHLQAIDYYERAIAVSPDPKPIRAYLAYLYFYLGNFEEALKHSEGLTVTDLDQFLMSVPDFINLVVNRVVPDPPPTDP